jgi:hypothetical protein
MSSAAALNEDRRSSRRWIINETVEILVGDKAYDFQITDVSAGGARVVSDMDLEPGMKVMLQLPESLQLTAKVVHKQSDGVGIQFEIGAADRTKLFDWISEASQRKNGG